MYPNLLGQKEFFHLTEQDMGEIIGVSAGPIANILISLLISYLLRRARSATFLTNPFGICFHRPSPRDRK